MLLREPIKPKSCVAGYGRQSRASIRVIKVILRNVDEVMTVLGNMLFPPVNVSSMELVIQYFLPQPLIMPLHYLRPLRYRPESCSLRK